MDSADTEIAESLAHAHSLTPEAEAQVQAVIDAHEAELAGLANVIATEPGFPVRDGHLVREPAIIVYVTRKETTASLAAEDVAPTALGGFPVDVIVADPLKQLELVAPQAEAAALVGLGYEGLPGDPIDEEIELHAPILCHVGPDAGWVTLRDFLAATDGRLTVAMYDFSADYIAKTLIDTALGNDVEIALTLDDGVSDAEQRIQDRIAGRLDENYSMSIVQCGGSRRFPSAYHPKVAVQDHRRVWLSSGNWSPRSQPELDPIGRAGDADGRFSRANREWHVIAEDGALAALFERYILHDKLMADEDAALAFVPPQALPDLFVSLDDLMALAGEGAALAATPPVAPARLPRDGRAVMVQPLLSPDNYARRITQWLRGARESLHLQYSYINYSKAAQDRDFRALLDHLADLSWRDGFDLKIIMGASSPDKARILGQNGFNEASVKIQTNIHNKGIVRDGTEVLVSSQNWSGDGFLRNRDAGLIIKDAEIAGYFDSVFIEDWDLRARDPFATAGLSAILAEPGAATPAGRVRMSWADYFGD